MKDIMNTRGHCKRIEIKKAIMHVIVNLTLE